MPVFEGRSLFVVDAPRLVRRLGIRAIAEQLHRAHCHELWVRVGRGDRSQPGLTEALCRDLQQGLAAVGVALRGWHVPFALLAVTLVVPRNSLLLIETPAP